MIDEIFDRHYRHGRGELNAAIVKALKHAGRSVSHAFVTLNRIEYSAPWAASNKYARNG